MKLSWFFIALISCQFAIADEKITLITKNAGLELFYREKPNWSDGEYFRINCESTCNIKKVTVRSNREKIKIPYYEESLGYKASLPGTINTIAFIKGLDNLKEGHLDSSFVHYNKNFSKKGIISKTKEKIEIDFYGNKLEISKIRPKNSREIGSKGSCKSQLVLFKYQYKEIERTIYSVCPDELLDGEYDVPALTVESMVIWVGDLDNDQIPDLIIANSLLLSSSIKPGEPWRPSAIFTYEDIMDMG